MSPHQKCTSEYHRQRCWVPLYSHHQRLLYCAASPSLLLIFCLRETRVAAKPCTAAFAHWPTRSRTNTPLPTFESLKHLPIACRQCAPVVRRVHTHAHATSRASARDLGRACAVQRHSPAAASRSTNPSPPPPSSSLHCASRQSCKRCSNRSCGTGRWPCLML